METIAAFLAVVVCGGTLGWCAAAGHRLTTVWPLVAALLAAAGLLTVLSRSSDRLADAGTLGTIAAYVHAAALLAAAAAAALFGWRAGGGR